MQSIAMIHAAVLLLFLITAVPAKKNLFAIQVLEGDGADEWEVTFSIGSSVLGQSLSGQGNLQKTVSDSTRSLLFDSKFNCQVGEEELTGDAQLELVPAGTGYAVTLMAGVRSASGLSATYQLQAHRLDTCPRFFVHHNVTTVPDYLFSFSSGLTETTCDLERNKSEIAIDLEMSSSLSPLVATSLQQVFVFNGDRGWEWMNATNPAIDVAVKAEWEGTEKTYRHRKTAKFASKIPLLPTFALEYINQADRIALSLLNDLPNQVRDEL